MGQKCHLFVSYAQSDDEDGAVSRLTEAMRAIYAQRTGQELRLFVDKREIQTAELWKERIQQALQDSILLLAVASPAYFSSEWCRREWDHFAADERVLPDHRARHIFPVYLHGEPKLPDPEPATEKWIKAVQSRQYIDLGGCGHTDQQYAERISLLMDHIVRALNEADTGGSEPVRDDIEHHDVVTGYVSDGSRFVRLLAKASNVTIVGITNEGLATMLQAALDQKRAWLGNPNAFWASLRIVFLDDKLLNSVNDELDEYPDRREQLRRRGLGAGFGKRSVEGFLASVSSSRWQLYESPWFPPFYGTLLEGPGDSRVVQLIMRRPLRRTPDHLYLEFEDPSDQYFKAAFEDIVHNSKEVHRVVLVGAPDDTGFQCTGARFRQNVLADGSGEGGWLPTVLVVTWWTRNGRPEPLLQLRTRANSTRELDRLSHLAGYIYQDPDIATEPGDAETTGFYLPESLPLNAARSRVQMETGSIPSGDMRFVTTQQYLHADKEHLYFFVYELEMPVHFQFPRRAQMCHLTVEELLAIRENQALRNTVRLCRPERSADASLPILAALEIATLNLTLHGHGDLGEDLLSQVGSRRPEFALTVERIAELEQQTRRVQRSGGLEVELQGLSGLQYREFFTILLPLYSKISIPNAAEKLAAVREDERKLDALERLSVLYKDEDVIASIPAEI
jgi:TIR domain